MGNQAAKDMQNGSAWLDMRQARAIWLITESQGADIKLKKARKMHEIKLQLDIYKEFPMGKDNIKFKRSMKLLLKVMAVLKGTPKPKRGLTT